MTRVVLEVPNSKYREYEERARTEAVSVRALLAWLLAQVSEEHAAKLAAERCEQAA